MIAVGFAGSEPKAQDRFVLTQSPYAELELLGMWVGAVMWIPKEENRNCQQLKTIEVERNYNQQMF